MKTTHYLYMALCLSAISAVSCTKESNSDAPVSYEECSIQAVAEQTTKTHISDVATGTVAWDSGDAISVFSENVASGINNKFSSSDISGSKASFSGMIDSGTTSFYAVYPHSDGLSYNSGVISNANIPDQQQARNGSFQNGVSLSIAKGTRTPGTEDCGTLNFNNLCSVLSFTLPSNITFADEIDITSKSGAAIAGKVSINCSSMSIDKSTATKTGIVLYGTFVGGSKYFVVVAPGKYENGFNFIIKTKGGNTYSRETTKTIDAAAGSMYDLGTLSLVLNQDDLSTSVKISHVTENNVLTGSTAEFTLTVNNSEFGSIIKNYEAVVTLKKGSDVYRTLTTSGTSISSVKMDLANGKYYIPKGEEAYSYTADITYTVSNGTKDVTRTLNYSGEVTSPQPSGFTLKASPVGYTSYSCYKGTDGQSASVDTANGLDGSTVYGIGAAYESGLSPNVYSQCSSLLSYNSTLDGTAASGNQGSKSWAAHTIGATVSFEGVTSAVATKDVYITGLPYNKNNDKAYNYKDDWSWTKNGSWKDDSYLNWYLATVNFKGFYIPGNINATISYRFKNYSGSSFLTYLKCWAGGTLFVNAEDRATSKWYEYKGTNNTITFTSSNNSIKCENSAKSSMASAAVATSQMFYFGAIYR